MLHYSALIKIKFTVFNHLNYNKMKKNMGSVDRIVRILVAVVIAILYFTHVLSGTVAIVLLVLAGIFVATSFMSFCPLYLPFGLSTIKKEQ
jgi:uncharacterized membrane protein